MNSEVARLREQIDLECRASWWALHGIASGTAQHRFITARLENVAHYHGKLAQLVGEEAATDILCAAFEPKGDEQRKAVATGEEYAEAG